MKATPEVPLWYTVSCWGFGVSILSCKMYIVLVCMLASLEVLLQQSVSWYVVVKFSEKNMVYLFCVLLYAQHLLVWLVYFLSILNVMQRCSEDYRAYIPHIQLFFYSEGISRFLAPPQSRYVIHRLWTFEACFVNLTIVKNSFFPKCQAWWSETSLWNVIQKF
jgi:hypothetical protein